jgi:hypothetical protein
MGASHMQQAPHRMSTSFSALRLLPNTSSRGGKQYLHVLMSISAGGGLSHVYMFDLNKSGIAYLQMICRSPGVDVCLLPVSL